MREIIKPPDPGDLITVDYYGSLYFGVLIKNFYLFSGEPALRYIPINRFLSSLSKNYREELQNRVYKETVRAYGNNLPSRVCKISLECLKQDKLDMELLQTVMNNIKREHKNYRTVNAI